MTIVRKTGALGATGSATVAVGIVPAAVASAGETGRRAWLDFFAAQIRNRNTRQVSQESPSDVVRTSVRCRRNTRQVSQDFAKGIFPLEHTSLK